MGGGALLPAVGAEGAAALDRGADRFEFFLVLRRVHQPTPVLGAGHRPGGEWGDLVGDFGVVAPPEAGPLPVLGLVDEVGASCVAFDVAGDGQEVVVGLDGEGFVGALVDVPAAGGVSVFVPASDVGDGESLHVSAQVAGLAWAKYQVPVVGHEAVGEDAHVDVFGGLGHDAFKGVVVVGGVEDGHAGDAAVDDVEDHVAGLDTGCSWHGCRVSGRG